MGSRRPELSARAGARFACAGDGLCCTDMHVLGPVDAAEAARFPTYAHARVGRALEVVGGACVLRGDAGGCLVHASKPASCRRFPFGLVVTPGGSRVTTSHRCPCRTMGDRPPIDLAEARASLGGRADFEVPDRVAWDAGESITFAEYASREAALLERLEHEDALAVLGEAELDNAPRWRDVAARLRARVDGSASGEACAWFGDVLLGHAGTNLRAARARPWAAAFDHAEARSPEARDAREVIADWAADVVWALAWSTRGTFARARAELAVRAEIATSIARQLAASGAREDRAAAEAVMIAEVAGATDIWTALVC